MKAFTRFRKVSFLIAGGLATLVCSAIAMHGAQRDAGASRRAVFIQVWKILGAKYYDQEMNGLDWTAVRSNFESRLAGARSSFDLYWNVLAPMARLLEGSHVRVSMPTQGAAQDRASDPQISAHTWNLESCAGLWIAEGRRPRATRITRISPDSVLYAEGVRPGWRLQGIPRRSVGDDRRLTAVFLTIGGQQMELAIAARPGYLRMDMNSVHEDLEALKRELIRRADPDSEFELKSLGIKVAIGQLGSMPSVIDVENGSEAERSGIEPGSELVEWSNKNRADGRIGFAGTLRSPRGVVYSASFDFLPCGPQETHDGPSAARLPRNLLYLRFDSFQPEVVAWLDEQLRGGADAVVLDLRRNSGGDAAVLLEVMGRFLQAGTHVANARYVNRVEAWTAGRAPRVFSGRVAILVSGLTASAAEVAAAALRFHGRAALFGQDTYGSVQLSSEFPLDDGGVVQVATAELHDPAGRRLEGAGIKVDQIIIPTLATVRAGRDPVLEAAITGLTSL